MAKRRNPGTTDDSHVDGASGRPSDGPPHGLSSDGVEPLAPSAFQIPDQPPEWTAVITLFLRRHVEDAGARGVVVGVSGGLDSSVAAALCVRALGREAVVPVIMPAADSDPRDAEDARALCTHLGLEPVERPVGPVVAGLQAVVGAAVGDKRTLGNAKARARMLVLYAEAQARGMLVCGTSDKSELLTGYFTKFGDGGSDLLPIGDLYKTQVRALGHWLGLPARLVDKPPSAGLWAGQSTETELGVAFADLDRILKGFELNQSAAAVAQRTGLALSLVQRIDAMVRRTEHKRRLPLVPKLGARTVGIDWRRSVHWDAPA